MAKNASSNAFKKNADVKPLTPPPAASWLLLRLEASNPSPSASYERDIQKENDKPPAPAPNWDTKIDQDEVVPENFDDPEMCDPLYQRRLFVGQDSKQDTFVYSLPADRNLNVPIIDVVAPVGGPMDVRVLPKQTAVAAAATATATAAAAAAAAATVTAAQKKAN